jgi:hypothetical protein
MVSPAILNQTAEHFVLATRFNRISCSRIEANRPTYLPFLWVVDKPSMLAGMKNALKK